MSVVFPTSSHKSSGCQAAASFALRALQWEHKPPPVSTSAALKCLFKAMGCYGWCKRWCLWKSKCWLIQSPCESCDVIYIYIYKLLALWCFLGFPFLVLFTCGSGYDYKAFIILQDFLQGIHPQTTKNPRDLEPWQLVVQCLDQTHPPVLHYFTDWFCFCAFCYNKQ